MLTKKNGLEKSKPRRGRKPMPPEVSRRNRVVTFVTDTDSLQLERLADEQGKSLSAVVYEILADFLKRQR